MLSVAVRPMASTILCASTRLWSGSIAAGGEDTDRTRAQFDEVLARREFDYEPSLVQRFMSWLGRQVERLLESLRIPGTSINAGTGIGSYLVTLVLIAMIIAIVVVLVRRMRRVWTVDRPDRETEAMTMRVSPNETGDGWMDDFVRGEDPGGAKLKILGTYRRIIDSLDERELLSSTTGDSPRELLDEINASLPSVGPLMTEATDIFEAPWYAADAGTDSDTVRLEQIASRILDADGHADGESTT